MKLFPKRLKEWAARVADRIPKRLKEWAARVADRILDGPKCDGCGHDMRIHVEIEGCLGAVYDDGDPAGWCKCTVGA